MLKASWPVAHWRRIRFRHGQLKVDKVVDFRLCHCFVSILPKVCRCRFVRQVSNNNLYLWRRRFDYFAQSPIRQLVTVDIVAKVEHVQLSWTCSTPSIFFKSGWFLSPECPGMLNVLSTRSTLSSTVSNLTLLPVSTDLYRQQCGGSACLWVARWHNG